MNCSSTSSLLALAVVQAAVSEVDPLALTPLHAPVHLNHFDPRLTTAPNIALTRQFQQVVSILHSSGADFAASEEANDSGWETPYLTLHATCSLL
jgi:hypothetical protein